ncbi:hypothetical protein K7432_008623 [Basidiobolus ranarum]|uniref:Uncharacterized protein n=1 Tax=Basidiobolus ranarum TaxID=34480 RepID=A0ABR2VYG4_9FUNG
MSIAFLTSTPDFTQAESPKLRYALEEVNIFFSPNIFGSQFEEGTLYVAENLLYFFSHGSAMGISIEYPSIIVHAIDPTGPGIYCQLQGNPLNPNQSNVQINNLGPNEYIDFTELRLIPKDGSILVPLYQAISDCASLHPDLFDNEDEGDWFTGESNDMEFTEQGQETLERLDSLIEMPSPQQFLEMVEESSQHPSQP